MIYAAPMEGITTFLYRRVHQKYFSGVDKYFTPFLAPNQTHHFKTREKNEFLPENNPIRPVPQLLTKSAVDFLWAAETLQEYGYQEINLNSGCPSPTVVTKGKGAGMLTDTNKLDLFFSEVFEKKPQDIKISMKTRIGMSDEKEVAALLEVWNRYPFHEIIIHPRLCEDYYSHEPRLEAFRICATESRSPAGYNGEIKSTEDYQRICAQFSTITSVMIGRGLIEDPALAREIKGGEPAKTEELKAFHDDLFQGYTKIMDGERDVLFKMKDLWTYMSHLFCEQEEVLRSIRRSKNFSEYRIAVDRAWISERKQGS